MIQLFIFHLLLVLTQPAHFCVSDDSDVETGHQSMHDSETLVKFQTILTNEIAFLERQILILNDFKQNLFDSLRKELAQSPEETRFKLNELLSLMRYVFEFLNRLIVEIANLRKLRNGMKLFVADQLDKVNNWSDDLIQVYPLGIFMEEFLEGVGITLDEVKRDIESNYQSLVVYMSLAMKAEHRLGPCSATSGPLHRTLVNRNSSLGFDIQRILRGKADYWRAN